MQAIDHDNVKIYNLSAGRSIPEWLTDRKRRALLKKNVDIRRRIELIQDFTMPDLSNNIQMSKDGQYILTTGIYKPRVKCFDVNNLSLKFERCFDAEAVTFEILKDDYSKLVFLQNDRYVEFHEAHGKYYRLRIPKYGRDMCYHRQSADLMFVGSSSEIYRLNLFRGTFMPPFESKSPGINKCMINERFNVLLTGTQDGYVEVWDPRSKQLAQRLDFINSLIDAKVDFVTKDIFPSITALQVQQKGLNIAVGSQSGHIGIFDIRSDKPIAVKDHKYNLPIKNIEFHPTSDLIYSMDSNILKVWDMNNNGKLFLQIEASNTKFNSLCVVPNSGLFFIANESPKIQTYFVPALGTAPKWAGFLDHIAEELEETNTEIIYDDYKFVTAQELEVLGLSGYIGTPLLRAYTHGYFMNIGLYKLYKDANDSINPQRFDEYRKKKIRERIETDRENQIEVNKLPPVNKELALKLMDRDVKDSKKTKKKETSNLLEDERFRDLFHDSAFEIDKNTEEYRLLNPVLSRLDKSREKELKKKLKEAQADNEEVKEDSAESSDDFASDKDESSEDEHTWAKEVKKEFRQITKERKQQERLERLNAASEDIESQSNNRKGKFAKMEAIEDFSGILGKKRKKNEAPLGERLEDESANVEIIGSGGNRQMVFAPQKMYKKQRIEEQNKLHKQERKKIARPTFGIKSKNKYGGRPGRWKK